jgi:hypothetical protein
MFWFVIPEGESLSRFYLFFWFIIPEGNLLLAFACCCLSFPKGIRFPSNPTVLVCHSRRESASRLCLLLFVIPEGNPLSRPCF